MFALHRHRHAIGICLALVALLTLDFGVARAQQSPAWISASFENGTLVVHGAGFAPNERVTVDVIDRGIRSGFTAEAGPDGDFGLFTNQPVTPGAALAIEARGEKGAVATVSATVSENVGPVRPFVLLPGPSTLPRTGGGPIGMAAVFGAGLTLVGGLVAGHRPDMTLVGAAVRRSCWPRLGLPVAALLVLALTACAAAGASDHEAVATVTPVVITGTTANATAAATPAQPVTRVAAGTATGATPRAGSEATATDRATVVVAASATPSAVAARAADPARAQGSPIAATVSSGSSVVPSPRADAPVASPAATVTGQSAARGPRVPNLRADYRDDRSTPEGLIRSYFDAVGHREYARAYSYWESGAAQLPPFADFVAGYADTTSVEVAIGAVGGGVGAGQLYFTVPVELTARTSNGGVRRFDGCYTLHLARPELQAAPPYHPLAIQSAAIRAIEASTTQPTAPTAAACDG